MLTDYNVARTALASYAPVAPPSRQRGHRPARAGSQLGRRRASQLVPTTLTSPQIAGCRVWCGMAPARWVIAREDDEEEASSEEEELGDEEVEEASADEAEAEADADEGAAGGNSGSSAAAPSPGSTIKQRKLNIKLGGAGVCHVRPGAVAAGMQSTRGWLQGALSWLATWRRHTLHAMTSLPAGVRQARTHGRLCGRQVHRLWVQLLLSACSTVTACSTVSCGCVALRWLLATAAHRRHA